MTYALGTLAFSYSLLFMSHQTTAVLLFAAFYRRSGGRRSCERRRRASSRHAGASRRPRGGRRVHQRALRRAARRRTSALDETSRTRAVSLSPWAAFGARRAPASLAADRLYHARVFGGPLETGYRHLADAAYQPWHQGGFLGIKTPDARAFLLSLFLAAPGSPRALARLALGLWGSVLLWRSHAHLGRSRALAIFTALSGRRIPLLHRVLQLRIMGLDDRTAAPHRSGSLPPPPARAGARALRRRRATRGAVVGRAATRLDAGHRCAHLRQLHPRRRLRRRLRALRSSHGDGAARPFGAQSAWTSQPLGWSECCSPSPASLHASPRGWQCVALGGERGWSPQPWSLE